MQKGLELCRHIPTRRPLATYHGHGFHSAAKITARWFTRLLACSLALFVAVACSPPGEIDSNRDAAWRTYSDQLAVRDWNDTIEVSPADALPGAASDGVVDLLVTSRSDEEIWFPPGYGTILLTYSQDDNKWEEVENLVTYLGNGDTIEPQQSEGSNWVAVASVAPALDFNDVSLLRVLIVGHVVRDGTVTEETVGGYVDVELSS